MYWMMVLHKSADTHSAHKCPLNKVGQLASSATCNSVHFFNKCSDILFFSFACIRFKQTHLDSLHSDNKATSISTTHTEAEIMWRTNHKNYICILKNSRQHKIHIYNSIPSEWNLHFPQPTTLQPPYQIV